QLARKLGIQNYAVIAKNIEQVNGRISYVALTEDIFEAFVGALNLEVDDDRSVDFVWKVIESEGDVAEIIRTQNNYKDQLMQYFHKFEGVRHDLQYDDVEIDSNDGKKRYQSTVRDKYVRGKVLGFGSGRTKKSSQQRAAKDALIKLGILGNFKEDDEYFEYEGNVEDEINRVREINNNKHDVPTGSNKHDVPTGSNKHDVPTENKSTKKGTKDTKIAKTTKKSKK
ncbi:MAG: ribonuclease III, partial [Dasosvirus sp.]